MCHSSDVGLFDAGVITNLGSINRQDLHAHFWDVPAKRVDAAADVAGALDARRLSSITVPFLGVRMSPTWK
jgi:hypothetical protein